MIIYEEFKAKNGKVLILNPNERVVQNIKHRCEINEGYCPCSPVKSPEMVCPCQSARDTGECHCGLYLEFLVE